jgi:hypothetical protein
LANGFLLGFVDGFLLGSVDAAATMAWLGLVVATASWLPLIGLAW